MPAETEIIRTLRGDIKPSELGRTNVHEHLLMRSPLLRGDGLDDMERSTVEAIEIQNAGIDALVELTPIGLGRDPCGVAKIAERNGLQVVLARRFGWQSRVRQSDPRAMPLGAPRADRWRRDYSGKHRRLVQGGHCGGRHRFELDQERPFRGKQLCSHYGQDRRGALLDSRSARRQSLRCAR